MYFITTVSSPLLLSLTDETFRVSTVLRNFEEADSNDHGSLPNITYHCVYDENKKSSSWWWYYNGDDQSRLPKCLIHCKDAPPPNNPPNVTRTWRYEEHWEGSKPQYKCDEGNITVSNHTYQYLCRSWQLRINR